MNICFYLFVFATHSEYLSFVTNATYYNENSLSILAFHLHNLFYTLENYTVDSTAEDAMRFAVIGDYGSAGSSEKAVADMIIGWKPDFITTVGDNNYPLGLAESIDANIGQYFHAFIGDYQGNYGEGSAENRFWPSLGNHDWGFGSIDAYLNYFSLPGNERYYRTVQGLVELFILDSDTREPDGVSSDSIQGLWLKDALADSKATYKVVIFHHAAYSSAQHGSSEWMQWPFAEWGATLILSGHDHAYERITHDGIPYIVDGAGGQSLYQFETVVEGSEARYNCNFGALLVDVTDQQMTLRFITIGGGLVDTFTIDAPTLKAD
ncbi:MAG: alkaline phosphatase [Anaerolineaceae bacterium]|nr:alkaline phosphatase [Anaerolineaceae bacterium]